MIKVVALLCTQPFTVSRPGSRLIAVPWRAIMMAGAASFWLSGSAAGEDPHLGLIEYEIACMPCHGIEGRGDGPLASKLANKPADLTQIAKANGGRFPSNEIARIIDGRKLSSAHRRTTMPIWGKRYSRRIDDEETAATIERRARHRIEALVRYIETLQQR
jgi:mono/diheme cytochrome c family protein